MKSGQRCSKRRLGKVEEETICLAKGDEAGIIEEGDQDVEKFSRESRKREHADCGYVS